MAELRQLAQHKSEFDAANTDLIAISTDDPGHAKQVWQGPAAQKVQILMDPSAKVLSAYGVRDGDQTVRTVVVLDENGQEIYRQKTDGIDETKLPTDILGMLKQRK